MTGQDVAQETDKWAEWAALASAANSVHFSVSYATSCPVTHYYFLTHNHNNSVWKMVEEALSFSNLKRLQLENDSDPYHFPVSN